MQRGLLGQNVFHHGTHFVGEGGERTEVMLPRGNSSQGWFASRRHEWVDVLHVIVVLFLCERVDCTAKQNVSNTFSEELDVFR